MVLQPTEYRDILRDDESLAKFLKALAKFDRMFCDAVADNGEFTLRLEVHGDKGELIHCRVLTDDFQRPGKTERRVGSDGKARARAWGKR